MANEFPDVVMLKVDVDECEEAAIEYNIQSMPTFVYLKSKKEVKLNYLFNKKLYYMLFYYIYIYFQVIRFSGANKEKLKENLLKFK